MTVTYKHGKVKKPPTTNINESVRGRTKDLLFQVSLKYHVFTSYSTYLNFLTDLSSYILLLLSFRGNWGRPFVSHQSYIIRNFILVKGFTPVPMWCRHFYTTRNKMYCYTQVEPPTPEPPSLSLPNHNSLYREKKNSISSSLPVLVKGKTLSGCHVSQREPADEVGHWECNTYWVSQDLIKEFSSSSKYCFIVLQYLWQDSVGLY